MPLGDVSYVNAALNAVVASWPASGAKYRLFTSDPSLQVSPLTVELTSGGGYAAVAFAPSNFAAASGGTIATTVPVSFGTSTAAYDALVTYWGIVDSTGLLVFSDECTRPIDVSEAGTAVAYTPSLAFAA